MCLHLHLALCRWRSALTPPVQCGNVGIVAFSTPIERQSDHVSAARAHNSLQAISKLPTETIPGIFDCLLGESSHLAPSLPELTAVCHIWRVVSLSYQDLWRDIRVAHDMFREHGDFPLPYTPNDFERLEAHFSRSGNAGISIILFFERDCVGLQALISLIYRQSHRFEILEIFVTGAASAMPHLACMLSPIPQTSDRLKELSLWGSLEWDVDDETPTPTVLYNGGELTLESLTVAVVGNCCPIFSSVDSSQLERLRLEGSKFSDPLALYRLLQGATSLRSLEVLGGSIPREASTPSNSSNLPEPVRLDNLQVLHLGGTDRDASATTVPAWSQVSSLLDVSKVTHFAAWGPIAHSFSPGGTFDMLIARMVSLRSLHIPALPSGIDIVDVGAWLSGKHELVGLLLPNRALAHPCATAFHPTKLPALRYLVLYEESEYETIAYTDVASAIELEMVAIFAINPLLSVAFSGFELVSGSALQDCGKRMPD